MADDASPEPVKDLTTLLSTLTVSRRPDVYCIASVPVETTIAVPCNVIAALHHDHLLVPVNRADDAIAAIEALAKAQPGRTHQNENEPPQGGSSAY